MDTLTELIESAGYGITTKEPRGYTKKGRIMVTFNCANCGAYTETPLHEVRNSLLRAGHLPCYCSKKCANQHYKNHHIEPYPEEALKKILSTDGYYEKYRQDIIDIATAQLGEMNNVEKKRITDWLCDTDATITPTYAARIVTRIFKEMGLERRDHDGKRYWKNPLK